MQDLEQAIRECLFICGALTVVAMETRTRIG